MTEVRHSFTFRFDQDFIRAALRRDRDWTAIKVVLIYAMIVPCLWVVFDGLTTLALGVLGGGFLATLALVLALFHKAGRRVLELWQQQSPSGTIRYDFDDDGFSIHMDNANSRFAWQGLRRLWRYPDVWLVEVVRKQSAFFPPAAASPGALEFVTERCRANGVRV